jgi:hypothetical protein
LLETRIERKAMGTGKSSKRQVAATRPKQQTELEDQRLRELVADLTFSEIILMQRILENQCQKMQLK